MAAFPWMLTWLQLGSCFQDCHVPTDFACVLIQYYASAFCAVGKAF